VAGVPEFQPEEVIRLLGRHDVRFVLIGGLAAVTHGAPLVTQDVDLCHARDPENLDRLAAALREVHAELRGADPGLPFRLDGKTLARGDTFMLTTDIGWIDIMATPAGTSGYEDLARAAEEFQLFGHRVLVAGIEDLIRMKRAAGRPKDLLALEELGALRDEIDERS
jgi:predicted nucleotidyltransferase